MTYQEAKSRLENGENFGNESAEWFTLNVRKDNLKCIVIHGEHKFYKNMKSYASRVAQLIRRGY